MLLPFKFITQFKVFAQLAEHSWKFTARFSRKRLLVFSAESIEKELAQI